MEPLWKVYADELKHHFPVHAFYNPEPSSEISPGTIGYIDGSGNWHMLERIPGTHPGSNIQDEGVQWGERWSNSIHKIAVHANANVTVPTHLPLGFELNAKYQSSSMRGAMLVCGTDVIRWRCTNAHATSRWALQNPARRRRQFGEALLYYDFYIVTTTLNTRGTFTVAWQHRQQNAGASFEVEVYKIGHVGAGAERWLDEGSEAWNRTRDDQGDRVVAFEGRRFRYKIFLFGLVLGVKDIKPSGKTSWVRFQIKFNSAIGDKSASSAAVKAIALRANELRDQMVKLSSLPTYTQEEISKMQEQATSESETDRFYYLAGDGKIIEFKLEEVTGSPPPKPPSAPLKTAQAVQASPGHGKLLSDLRDLSIDTAAKGQAQSAMMTSYHQPGSYNYQSASYNTQPNSYSNQPASYVTQSSTYNTNPVSYSSSQLASTKIHPAETNNIASVNPTVHRTVEQAKSRNYSAINRREDDKRYESTRSHTQSRHRTSRRGYGERAPSFVPSDESDDSSEEERDRTGKRDTYPRRQGTKREVR